MRNHTPVENFDADGRTFPSVPEQKIRYVTVLDTRNLDVGRYEAVFPASPDGTGNHYLRKAFQIVP